MVIIANSLKKRINRVRECISHVKIIKGIRIVKEGITNKVDKDIRTVREVITKEDIRIVRDITRAVIKTVKEVITKVIKDIKVIKGARDTKWGKEDKDFKAIKGFNKGDLENRAII